VETNLYRYIVRRSLRPQLVLIAISFVLGLGLNPLMLDLQKQIINKAIGRGNLEALFWLCGGFLGAVLANGALKYVRQNLEGFISETMLRDLRGELQRRILRFPLPHFRTTSTGQLVAMILGEVEDLGGYFGIALSTPAFHGAMLLGTVGYMLFANPWMALLSVVLFPIQMFFIRKLQRRVTEMSRERVRMVRGLSDRIQEAVGGIQEIYANDTVAYEATGFARLLQRIFRVRLRIYNLKYLIKWINNFLEKFGQFVLLLVGGWVIIHQPEAFNLGALVAFLQAYGQLNEPWRELINYVQQKENARVKYEQVIANFDPPGLRPEFALEEPPPGGPPLAGGYELRQASVVLEGTTSALDHLQLSLPAGRHVAVVGTAGSGKSTLALVLARLCGYSGSVLLDGQELAQIPAGVIGRQVAYVGSDARLFTGSLLDNVVYGLRHRGGTGAAGADQEWLDPTPLGVPDRAALVPAALETLRLVELDADLFSFGLRATVDPEARGELAGRLLEARRLVIERVAGESGEVAVEFFDPARFSRYASLGENVLFGHSPRPELALDRLADHPHFRAVVAAVGLEGSLVELGSQVAREMVEIFKDIGADNELFANYSLIAASELPDYVQLVSRLERGGGGAEPGRPGVPSDLRRLRARLVRGQRRLAQVVRRLDRQGTARPGDDRDRLIRLALRLIPARHRLGRIDEAFVAKVVAARRRFVETLPPDLAHRFVPYDRDRYFRDGTILDNLLFGKVVATSSLAVKRVNAIVEEVLVALGLREAVTEVGLDAHVGLFGSRLAPAQRQRVALARALLKRPQILILDTALAALEASEREPLHQRLRDAMKDRTVIAVVERVDLARHYDRVVVLDAGKVAEAGTFPELIAEDGLLRRLAAQAGVVVGAGR
jgi:ABC-type multidrug transport system fused ATPase/permease subunit